MTTLYIPKADDLDVKPFKWDDHYDFPRNSVGYGSKSHNPQWPNGAKIAVSFVINYEEGAENCVLNGDLHSGSIMYSQSSILDANARAQRLDFGRSPAVLHTYRSAQSTLNQNTTTDPEREFGDCSDFSTSTILNTLCTQSAKHWKTTLKLQSPQLRMAMTSLLMHTGGSTITR